MPFDPKYLGPESNPRPNYSPWLQGEQTKAAATAAAFNLIAGSLDRLGERRDRREEKKLDRQHETFRDDVNRTFQSQEAEKARASSQAFQFGERVAEQGFRQGEAVAAQGRTQENMRLGSKLNIDEAQAKADMEKKQRDEQARQYQEAARLATMAMWDTGYSPVMKVKKFTLKDYMPELRSQGGDLEGYLGAQRDPTKAEGLIKMATEPQDLEWFDENKGTRLASTIEQRTGIRPEIAQKAVKDVYGHLKSTLEDAAMPKVEAFNKARGIEAPVRQQTETGTLMPKTSAGSLTPGQADSVASFEPNESGVAPLSSDLLKVVGMEVTDIVPGAGKMAAGFENEIKGYSLVPKVMPNGALAVHLEGDLSTPFGQELARKLAAPVMQDRLLGLYAGGPANDASALERMGNAVRQRAGGGRPMQSESPAPAAAPQQNRSAPAAPAKPVLNGLPPKAAQKVSDFLFGTTPQD